MPYFSRFLHRLTVCVLAFVGLFAVNSCLAAYTVNYLCGDGTGETPADAINIQTGADFVPAANTCTTPENYEFDGWSVSGTNDVIPANTPFTWEYTENKYFIAHYTKKTSCSAGQSWETYTCDLSDAIVGNPSGSEQTGGWGARAINGATGSDYTRPLNNYPLAKGEWVSIMFRDTIKGRAFCSDRAGNDWTLTYPDDYKDEWLANDSELIAAGTGDYCWCKISNSLRYDNIKSDWVFSSGHFSSSTCSSYCAIFCAHQFRAPSSINSDFRPELYNAVTRAEQEKCEINANLYSITYSNLLNATWDENQLHPDSYTTGEEITIGIPTREGYTFDGWCDDAELTQNCTTEKVIPAGSTGDKTFYAKWTALPCGAGYESQPDIFSDTDYFAPGRAYSYFGAADRNEHFVSNGLNIDLDNTLEALPAGRFEIFFATDADSNTGFHAMMYGRAQCSSTVGYTGNWEYSGHGQSVPDTISETPGNYCWCQFDKMVPYTKSGSQWVPDGEPIDFVTKWLSPGGQTCTPYSCAGYCTKKFHVQTPERKALYGPGALPPCKIKTYTISYELDGGEWPIALVSKPETYNITSATINLPTPAEREGYTFGGWYDNNSFTGNLITQIPSGSYGNKTFYAKWTENIVEPEEPVEPDTEQEPTPVDEPDECALASCVVTIDFGNGQTTEKTFDNGDDLVMPVQAEPTGSVFNGYCEGTPTCTEPQMRLTTEQIENGATMYPQYIPVSTGMTAPSVEERTCLNDACEIILNYDDSTESSANIDLNSGSNNRSASALRRGGILRAATTNRSARTFNRGELLITPMLVKQGYTLQGYCVDETDTCSAPIAAVSYIDLNTKSRVTITPKWSLDGSIPGTYTITYDTAGGTPTYSSATYTIGDTVSLPADPTKEGYTFKGWCVDSATCAEPIDTSTWAGATKDVTLYAQWEIIPNSGCQPGYYSSQDSGECTICEENHYCIGGENSTMKSCPSGLVAPVGTVSANECGKIMRIGENVLYLTQKQQTTPALAVKIDDKIYYAKTTPVSQIEQPTKHFLRTRIDGIEYSIHDNAIQRRN